jgi:septum site-determining protein MinC
MSHKELPSLSLDIPPPSATAGRSRGTKAYEIKGYLFSMLAMCLKHSDLPAIEQQLQQELVALPDFLSEPLVLDLSEIAGTDLLPDFAGLLAMIRGLGLEAVGICNANEAQQAAASEVGLQLLQGGAAANRRTVSDKAKEPAEKPRPATAPQAAPAADTPPKPATRIVSAPVRTGQRIFASDGDLTLLAGVNSGAEVLAAGSIHVYGPLRGRALAGVQGDTKARIFTLCMEAELVSIAGCFRVIEDDLSPELQGKAAQIYLDGERIVIAPIK